MHRYKAMSLALKFESEINHCRLEKKITWNSQLKPNSKPFTPGSYSPILANQPKPDPKSNLRITDAEKQNRLLNGECFRCGYKYGPGHRCKTGTFKVLEAEEENEEQQEIETSSLDIDPDEIAGINLHVILGKPHPTTMKVHGKLNFTKVLILIDGGSTHNFISDILVSELKLVTQLVAPFGVQIGNGDVIRCGQICKDISLQVNDLKIIQDFHPFSLGGADLVLGIQWGASGTGENLSCSIMANPFQCQTVLTKKDGFIWSTEALLAFNTLKQALLTAPALQLPDFSKTFVVECDASSEGVGAILSQDEHPGAYFSKGFSLSNRVKSAYDRELLALRITSSEQQRLLLKLMPYDFSIHHRAGKENRGPDALSRMPHSGELLTLTIPYCVEVTDIKSGLQTDPFISDIIRRLLFDPTAVPDFHLVEQFLFYKNRLVIPDVSNIKLKLLQEAHITPIGGHGLLQPLPIPTQIWKDISMDFIVGLPPSNRFDTILVVVDRLSKYTHFICLSHPFTAKSVASVFCKEIVRLHGFPCSIVLDRDVIFLSNFWQELFRLSQTKLQLSTSYHPQTDGQTKVHNRCLEAYLRCFAAEQPTKWSSYLPWAEFSCNTGYRTSTGTTPFSVVYDRESLPLFPYVSGETKNNELEQQLITRDDMIKLIRLNLSRAQDRMRNQVNSHGSPVAYELQLPSDARIHPIFYVLMLKPAHGSFDDTAINPLPVTKDWEADLQPDSVISHRWVSEAGNLVLELLISWSNRPVKEAT
uniref:Peroxidase 64 n=1 Tax=Tanacetum cinerariifolium TaxID=118510 RepID=A0A6L2JIA7_TANCI|nr:peroxidase 64 [Tanacetum cinerariifolium]